MNAPKDRCRQLGPCPRRSSRGVDDVNALATVDECSYIHVDSDSESDMTVSSNIGPGRASELLASRQLRSLSLSLRPEGSLDSSTIRLYKMSSSPARENLPEQWIMDSPGLVQACSEITVWCSSVPSLTDMTHHASCPFTLSGSLLARPPSLVVFHAVHKASHSDG